uniref:Uncharacterized protein n=1 Tax=Phaeocystis antarctica TaxID=33657 RepID=A0A7S0F1E8_9EUKA|mmetsp:Transcript_34381/g.81181  ORF Transcript_34381/g.81181 Transcript_34381/m.81181 type:complete len:884 (+) Transcript_34381:589-3240(+)
MAPTSNVSIATTEVLVSPKGEMIAVAPLTNEKGSLLSASGQSVKTDAAKYVTDHDAEGMGAFLDADFEALTSVLSITVDYLAGATIVLPIASWERRFILERFIDTAQSDDFDGGGGEDGSGGSADGFYGVMLMSSTHHRYAGLFTIRKLGARPVTQLLVRGSDEESMAHMLLYSANYTVLEEALTTSKVMTGRRLLDCGLNPGRRLWGFISDVVDVVVDNVIDPAIKAAAEAAEAARKAAEEALAVVARNLLVCDLLRGFKVTWDAASKGLVDAAEATASAAAATATTLLNEAKAATRAVQNAADAAANLATVTLNKVKDAAEKAAATATKFIDDVGNAFSELGDDIQSVFDGVEELVRDIGAFATKLLDTMLDVANNAIGAISDLAVKVAQEIGNALQLDDKGLCIAPSCPGAFGHINSGDEEDLVEELDDLEILALTTVSVCFNVNEPELDLSGLGDAIKDFWLNNPAVKAVKDAVDEVIKPIEAAVNEVKQFVKTLKDFFESLSFRRRLEELTPAEVARARGLKEQAHSQLEQVRGRLLHADNDDARDSTKERLLLDVHRRLEAHLAERKLAARQLGSELVSISSLKASITLEINSRMRIEGQKDDNLLIPFVSADKAIEKLIPLPPTPFAVKLSAAFSADIHLEVQVEGDFKALVRLVSSGMGVTFDLSTGADNPAVFSDGDWTNSEFKLIGQASLSAQFQVKLKVSMSFSICLGPVCGGVQAKGFWDMAVGVDLALTTTTAGSNGLDGLDKLGCREWAFQSKLTNYAEYPQSDLDHINSIRTAANGGLALLGGWYVYVTLPYLYVRPIIELGECTVAFAPILSFGGAGECNWDNVEKTCKSDKTIKDTMGDQGWPGMWYNVGDQGRGGLCLISYHRVP